MSEILLLVAMAFVCGGIGLPFSRLLPAPQYRWRLLTAPTLGLAILAVAVTAGYRYGATIPTLLGATTGIALLCWVLGMNGLFGSSPLRADAEAVGRVELPLIGVAWLVLTIVLLAPHWVGGTQFSVFQGNQWDAFGYLNSAVVYAREPYSVVVKASRSDLLRNPLWVTAQQNLAWRPAVHLLYGMFSSVAPSEAYRLSYPFLVFLLAQFPLVTLFILRNALPGASTAGLVAAAAAFPMGFWGQYVFDINAWSQLASIPLMLLLSGLLLHTAVSEEGDLVGGRSVRIAVVVALLVAGGLYLYPESLVFHLMGLVPLTAFLVTWRLVRLRRRRLGAFVPMLGVGGLAMGALYYEGTIGFVVRQMTAVDGKSIVNWWKYFQAFFAGRDAWNAGPAANLVDFGAGFAGLYFLTPSSGAGFVVSAGLRGVIAVTIVGVASALGVMLLGRSPPPGGPDLTRTGRSFLRACLVLVGLMLLPPLYWCFGQNYWPAGKALSYIAPLFITCLAVPIAFRPVGSWIRAFRFIVVGFVAIQIASGVARIRVAQRPNGVHYAAPYPAVLAPEMKTALLWEMDRLKKPLHGLTRVFIEPTNAFSESYLMVFLYAQGIDFHKGGPVMSLFNTGEELGTAPPPGWPAEAFVAADRTLRVRFADGRTPVVMAPAESPE